MQNLRNRKPGDKETTLRHKFGVVLTNSYFRCTDCGRLKEARHFGLRRVNGQIRNQPQCTRCRSKYHTTAGI